MKDTNNTLSQRDIETKDTQENLDASRLAKYGFTKDIPLDIMGDAQHSIAYYVDGYFSMLDAPKDVDPFLMSISDHSEEFQKRRDEVMYRLMDIPGFMDGKIQSARIIQWGILEIHFHDREAQKMPLITAWNTALKSMSEQKQAIEKERQSLLIQDQVREKEKKLQDIVAKEAFYDGSVVLEYALGTATVAAGGILLVAAGSLVKKGTTYAAKSMIITDEDGVKKRLYFKKPFIGTSNDFRDSIGAILRKTGYDYDPITKKPYSVTKRLIKAFGKDLENLKYEDFKKTPEWQKMSEQEFQKFKTNALNSQKKMIHDYDAWKITPKWASLSIKRIMGEAVLFFPFVASEYHNNQSAHSILNAFASEWAFAVGAKIGSKIPAPGLWKVATTIGGWALAAIGWGVLLEKMDARRHVWLSSPKVHSMNYRNERSIALHVTSLGGTEILWGINSVIRKMTGNKNSAFDLGIERMHIFNPITGWNIFTIPEMNFYQNKVTMGTKPWEWINSSVKRNVEDWNAAVDRYKIEASEEIYEILGHYYRNEGIFSNQKDIQKAWGKEKLLTKELIECLMWENDTSQFFMWEMKMLVDGIIAEASKDKPMSIPNSTINEIIHTSIGGMKINPTLFVEERSLYWKLKKQELLSTIDSISHLTDEQKKFFQKIPDRMLANEDLYKNDAEKKLYESVLRNENIMNSQGGQSLSVGNYMADWLDQVADWKHETRFVQKVKEWRWGEKDWAPL